MHYGLTIDLNFLGFSLLCVISFLIYFAIMKIKKVKFNHPNIKIIIPVFIFYLTCVLYFVWIPFDIIPKNVRYELMTIINNEPFTLNQILNINLVPLRSILNIINSSILNQSHWYFTIRAIIGNIMLLFPLSIFIQLLSKRNLSTKQMLLLVMLVSISIELSQLVINLTTGWPNRVICIDDVILNTLGGMSGYVIYKKYDNFFIRIFKIIHKFVYN